jgi:hypothetical protein
MCYVSANGTRRLEPEITDDYATISKNTNDASTISTIEDFSLVSDELIRQEAETTANFKSRQHNLKVQQHELRVQQHELKVQQHELKVQQHEFKVQQHESNEVNEFLIQSLDDVLKSTGGGGFSPATDEFMRQMDNYFKPTDIFVKPIDKSILFILLDRICLRKSKYYVIDKNSYKSMLFTRIHVEFLNQLYEYYNPTKHFYLNRELTYNSFTNIVRQICKNNDIKITSQVRYNKSASNIDFYVYF